jgi:DNA-binding MarR family transcriptional regulator
MGLPAIPPQPDFLIQLRQAQHAIRTRLDADLAATGLTTPQYAVLAEIDQQGELSASDLAREFGMTAQTVNVLVKGLETAGLLRRRAHPTHGRILLANLTVRGRRALKRGRAVCMGVQDRVLCDLSASERRTLMRHLKTIQNASSPPALRATSA